MKPLVLVAHEAEAKYLPADIDLVLTGVGMNAAAVVTTRAILERCPDAASRAELEVINLGSVGSLVDGLAGIQRPSAVINRNYDADLMASLGVTLPMTTRIELGGDGPVLGSGDSFVAGGELREKLTAHCQLVDMEGFAIAYACRELGVKLTMIKHVSDSADEEALAWDDLVDISARDLAEEFATLS